LHEVVRESGVVLRDRREVLWNARLVLGDLALLRREKREVPWEPTEVLEDRGVLPRELSVVLRPDVSVLREEREVLGEACTVLEGKAKVRPVGRVRRPSYRRGCQGREAENRTL
jgi:hypothetical protein